MYQTKHTIHILLLRCILYNSKGLTVKKVMVEVGKNKFCTGNRPKEILASPLPTLNPIPTTFIICLSLNPMMCVLFAQETWRSLFTVV